MLTRSMLKRFTMVAGIFGLGFLLVSCNAPRVYYPEELCVETYQKENTGRGGGVVSVCKKYALKCPDPLVIEEAADKTMICRLKKSEGF